MLKRTRKAGNAPLAHTGVNSSARAASARCKACEDRFDPMPRKSACSAISREGDEEIQPSSVWILSMQPWSQSVSQSVTPGTSGPI